MIRERTPAEQAASLRDLADEIEAGARLPLGGYPDESVTVLMRGVGLEALSAIGPDFELSWSGRYLVTVLAKRGAVELYGTVAASNLPEEIWPADRPD